MKVCRSVYIYTSILSVGAAQGRWSQYWVGSQVLEGKAQLLLVELVIYNYYTFQANSSLSIKATQK